MLPLFTQWPILVVITGVQNVKDGLEQAEHDFYAHDSLVCMPSKPGYARTSSISPGMNANIITYLRLLGTFF